MNDEIERHWITVEADAAVVAGLSAEIGVSSAIASILVARGFETPAQVEPFLNPRLSDLSDPFAMPDMRQAVKRIWAAIVGHERILVFGDYDADGITSTALLVCVLRALGAEVDTFLPSRQTDGYGLTVAALERCADATPAPRLIVTVDCGTGSYDAVAAAAARGIDVVVTDHHEAVGRRAQALAVVNPKLGGNPATRMLAGVGVAFKLCHGLLLAGREAGQAGVDSVDMRAYLDLVAVGTVADVVPLLGENRILVRYGLAQINAGTSPGLGALIRVAGVRTEIDCYHLGFLIGPRLNAAGRLGDAAPALELLLADDLGRARRLAGQLDAANRERKRIEEQIILDAAAEIEHDFNPDWDCGIVVGGVGWHIGAIGIVAARLCGRYHRPSVVVAFDEQGRGRGSCRSVDSVDVVAALTACGDLLESFGGHKAAAGLSICRENLTAFRERFNAECRKQANPNDLIPTIQVDAWITLGEADVELLKAIEDLRPLGLGNPTPTWGTRNIRLLGKPRVVGKNHLKMEVASGATQIAAIAFGMAGREIPNGPLDLLYQVQENSYLGRRSIQLNIKDFRAAEEA